MNEVWLVILPLIAGYLLDLAFGDPRTIPRYDAEKLIN